ncbi:biopolymer transporter ExbD [Geothrix sp. 21YS21S-4]|uniref:ExbD/TolR family protein n=1 Tax=Geothrix sp. 21YS21S-4 TaxID=3068889 RepID=UPI0027B88DDD|nr:biopolymer transporter ExbD [Geothrix sp. 21YS21S-4]
MTAGLRSDINITPLIDIVLVLLIVFITLVPALPRALAATLPREGGSGGGSLLRLALGADGGLRFEGAPISAAELAERVCASSGRVRIDVHPSLPFQRAASVLDAVKGARPDAAISLTAAREEPGPC